MKIEIEIDEQEILEMAKRVIVETIASRITEELLARMGGRDGENER